MNRQSIDVATDYVESNISGLLEKMTIEILINKPEQPVEFMIDWLEKNGEKAYSEAKANLDRR